MNQIEKKLSKNDVGETGAHQAGFLIPKSPASLLAFFPPLDPTIRNPRVVIDMVDDEGAIWTFPFIYYNSKLLGTGTRNEYRLTGMTPYFRKFNLKEGDTIVLTQEGRNHRISYRRKDAPVEVSPSGRKVLKLSGSWTVIDVNAE